LDFGALYLAPIHDSPALMYVTVPPGASIPGRKRLEKGVNPEEHRAVILSAQDTGTGCLDQLPIFAEGAVGFARASTMSWYPRSTGAVGPRAIRFDLSVLVMVSLEGLLRKCLVFRGHHR
jgi:hypothetical protein